MSQRLEGKTAVITGGGRGIGRAIALAYVQAGATCIVASRQLEDLEATARLAPHGAVEAIVCDVASDTSVAAMAELVLGKFGGVDIVVINAGVHAAGSFLEIDAATYSRLYEVNVVGIVRVSQAFLGGMIERCLGSIVNIASTA